jgi:hypothetical protein
MPYNCIHGFKNIEKDLMILDIQEIKGDRHHNQNIMDTGFRSIGLPRLDDVQDIQAKKTRSYDPMSSAVRKFRKIASS